MANQKLHNAVQPDIEYSKPCRIELFGGLRVRRGAIIIARFRSRQTASLLAFLAFHGDKTHARETLIEMLWPECEIQAGRNSLSVALSSLRAQLGDVFNATRQTIQMQVSTDVGEFLRAIKAAETQDSEKLQRACDLYNGRLLSGFYDEWIAPEERRLEELFFRAVRQLLASSKDATTAIAYAERALSFDATREDIACDLISFLDAHGHNAKALRHARDLNRVLEREQIAPSTATRQLIETLEKRAKMAFDETSKVATHIHLPQLLTTFFGRETETAQVREQLETARLLTLTGTGGAGKTRLSIEAARELGELFRGGIWFVALADIDDSALLGNVIAQTLGAPPSPLPPLHRVLDVLPRERCLLLLDNFEQLLPKSATFVQQLLESAPQLSVLVTSRTRLKLPIEREFVVPTLPTPRDDETVLDIGNYAGVELFVHRAQASRATWKLTGANAPAVATLCRRLDGLPLAIEIAASRIGVLSASQIVAHLDDRFELLRSDQTDFAPRHRTLRATLDWSFDLLPSELREVWKRLSVFRGGASLEAAQAVCVDKRVLDALSQLRDASLLITEEDSCGKVRYRLLETLREYASEKMTLFEREETCRAHAAFFADFAERAALQSANPRPEITTQLMQEDDNFRVALLWSSQNDARLLMRLCATFAVFWESWGRFAEGVVWLETALRANEKLNDGEANAAQVAPILCAAGRFALHCGDATTAKSRLNAALETAIRHRNRATEMQALSGLGWLELQRDTTLARDFFRRSLQVGEACGEQSGIGTSLWGFIAVSQTRAEFEEVREMSQRALQAFRAANDERNCVYATASLGHASYFLRDFFSALEWYRQAEILCRKLGDDYSLAGIVWGRALIARHRGDLSQAREDICEMHALNLKTGNLWGSPMVLQELTYQLLAAGKPEIASQLQGATDALSSRVGYTLAPAVRAEREEQEMLLQQTQNDALLRQQGAILSLQEAVDLALRTLKVADKL